MFREILRQSCSMQSINLKRKLIDKPFAWINGIKDWINGFGETQKHVAFQFTGWSMPYLFWVWYKLFITWINKTKLSTKCQAFLSFQYIKHTTINLYMCLAYFSCNLLISHQDFIFECSILCNNSYTTDPS